MVLLMLLITVGFVLGRKLLSSNLSFRTLTRTPSLWLITLIALIFLGITGHFAWLTAIIGLLITFVLRNIPLLLRYAPQLHHFWRSFKTKQQHENSAASGATMHGKMTPSDAYKILGLTPPVTKEDIILAHKKLMQKMHPDRGGSAYLASQINLAKDCLLKN